MALKTAVEICAVATAFAFSTAAASGELADTPGHLTMEITQVQHGDAVISMQELIAANRIPKAARRLYEKAIESDRKGRADVALEQARAAIDIFPQYFQAEAAVAVAYLKRGDFIEAQHHVQVAAALNPHYLPAQEIQGLILYFWDRLREAADALGDFVKTAPCRKTAHYYLGLALRNLGDSQQADYHLRTAQLLQLNPMSSRPEDITDENGSSSFPPMRPQSPMRSRFPLQH
ncbi:MAG TPA: hypothetical protein VHN81_02535 [Edaphobacter sp.]|nr:hypothetical protein [Edaphobacter sp.]